MDLHSGQCVGYFDIPVDHVYGDSVLLDYLASKRISTGDLVRSSPPPLPSYLPLNTAVCDVPAGQVKLTAQPTTLAKEIRLNMLVPGIYGKK